MTDPETVRYLRYINENLDRIAYALEKLHEDYHHSLTDSEHIPPDYH